LLNDTRSRTGIISGGGTLLPLSRTASSTTRIPSGRRWMSAMRPSTLMLNSGRLMVGVARLEVRQVARPKPNAAATRPMHSARALLPDGASATATPPPAAITGASHSAGSTGSSK
jgi:hypothetical protein